MFENWKKSSLLINSIVHCNHYNSWYPKWYGWRNDSIQFVNLENAFIRVFLKILYNNHICGSKLNIRVRWLTFNHIKWSDVVYQPKNIGANDIRAGKSHIIANIKNTVCLVMYRGYSIIIIMNIYVSSLYAFVWFT